MYISPTSMTKYTDKKHFLTNAITNFCIMGKLQCIITLCRRSNTPIYRQNPICKRSYELNKKKTFLHLVYIYNISTLQSIHRLCVNINIYKSLDIYFPVKLQVTKHWHKIVPFIFIFIFFFRRKNNIMYKYMTNISVEYKWHLVRQVNKLFVYDSR